jgi:hypothetical protein
VTLNAVVPERHAGGTFQRWVAIWGLSSGDFIHQSLPLLVSRDTKAQATAWATANPPNTNGNTVGTFKVID